MTIVKSDSQPLTVGAWVRNKDVITPQDLGAVADGTTPAQDAFLALSATNRPMLVPPGEYFIDNSSIRQINAYTGELTFAPGARLIFSDNTKKGLYFVGGSPKIRGVTLTTAVASTTRQLDAPMIDLYLCTDPIISDVVVERGAGAGVLVRTCTGLRANNIVVRNTLADGMDLFNCSDSKVANVLTDTTGDDGFAALDYADQPVSQRVILTNIICRNSNARGITINGPTNLTLDGFLIEETQGSGLMIEEDATAGIRVPTGIKVSNGTIKRAGQRAPNPSYTGNKYGIEVGESGTVDLTNVTVVDAKTRGVSASSGQGNAHLTTIGVRVETAGTQGFNVDGQTAWTFDDIHAQDTAAQGFYTHDVRRIVGGIRTAVRTCKTGGNFRAIHDDSNAFLSVKRNVIIDDQAPPTGYIYRADGGTEGSVGTFDWQVNGAFYYDNFAPYLVNHGHSGPRRDGLSMPTGSPEIINADSTLDRYILGALTADKSFTLPANGQFHGMKVSVARYDVAGTNTVSLIDPNNGSAVVTTIPAGTGAVPTKATVWWDAVTSRWRADGKIPL
ncbi:right-handed parallel beta-helix repeat-containing protein [Sphingomonas sp.]|uniref:right-handed parallel beta-helix repeat-containing protein n=1 Tax=Sphingomonas sp. TaxID=28214 RepID=UPI0028970742|nr:right-handed parallel beta-helix repeat-containing protein [Sphingomonas sp.]